MYSVAHQIGTNLYSVRQIPPQRHIAALIAQTACMWAPVPEPLATVVRAAGNRRRSVVVKGRAVPVAGLVEFSADCSHFGVDPITAER